MNYKNSDHTFAVCAYKESQFLEECVKSLLAQTVRSNIIIATSTPNGHIRGIAEKYGLPLFVNNGVKGIGGDWNFAYSCADTPLVTIAHQDDIYEPDYTKEMLEYINRSTDPIIYFCGYAELRGGEKVYNNRLLKVKKLMLSPLKVRAFWKSRFVRRRVLSFGCPICCPAVTMVTEKFGENQFTNDFLSNIDWQQWERQSRKKGSFVYNPSPLMCHRIHGGSATTEIIADNKRTDEDFAVFSEFWPKPIAKFLVGFYSKSQNSNDV